MDSHNRGKLIKIRHKLTCFFLFNLINLFFKDLRGKEENLLPFLCLNLLGFHFGSYFFLLLISLHGVDSSFYILCRSDSLFEYTYSSCCYRLHG